MPELTCVASGCSQLISAYQAEQTEAWVFLPPVKQSIASSCAGCYFVFLFNTELMIFG